MKFTIKNKVDQEILFTGTKQECMHFIKCRKLDRQEIVIQGGQVLHITVPREAVAEVKQPGLLKRIFTR